MVHCSLGYSFPPAVSLVWSVAHLSRSVEAVPAGVTVDASRVLLAVDADSAPSVLAFSVQAEREIGHRLVVVAVQRLVVAVTLWQTDRRQDDRQVSLTLTGVFLRDRQTDRQVPVSL